MKLIPGPAFCPEHRSLFLLGFNAIAIQTLFFRELYSSFGGNALLPSLLLTLWMLYTALGALLGKWKRIPFRGAHGFPPLFMIWFAMAGLPLFYYSYSMIFLPGYQPGPYAMMLMISILILPVCMTAGFGFSRPAAAPGYSEAIASGYAAETLGSVAGGLVLNFILLFFFSTWQSLGILGLISALLVPFLPAASLKKTRILAAILTLPACIWYLWPGSEEASIQKLFPAQTLEAVSENRFGKTIIARASDQMNLYENGMALSSSGDRAAAEEAVHYAFLQRDTIRNVLLLQGWMPGIFREMKKYRPEIIDFTEQNPDFVEVIIRQTDASLPEEVRVFQTDPSIFIARPGQNYDVVLVHAGTPGISSTERFYCREFIQNIHRRLRAGGVVSYTLPGAADYSGPLMRKIQSSVVNTLQSVFRYVEIIPGNHLCLLASDRPLSTHIVALYHDRGPDMQNTYVNEYYLDDAGISQKSAQIRKGLIAEVEINTLYHPVTFYYGYLWWAGHYGVDLRLFLYIVAGIFLLALASLRPANVVLLSAGFSSSALGVMVIMSFQSVFGYVYYQAGVLFTVFMAGLLAGSILRLKLVKPASGSLPWLITASSVLPVIFGWLLIKIPSGAPGMELLFYAVQLLSGLITGMLFRMIVTIRGGDNLANASVSYAYELGGSASGALLSGLLAVPVFGVVKSLTILSLISVFALMVVLVNRRFRRYP